MRLLNQRNINHTVPRAFEFIRDGGPSNNQTAISTQSGTTITGIAIQPNKRYILKSVIHALEFLSISNDATTIGFISPALQLFLSNSIQHSANGNYPINPNTGIATNGILVSDVILPYGSPSFGGEYLIGGAPTSPIPLVNPFGQNTIALLPFYSRVNILNSITVNTDPIQANDIVFDSYSYSFLMIAGSYAKDVAVQINSPNTFGYVATSTFKCILEEYSLD